MEKSIQRKRSFKSIQGLRPQIESSIDQLPSIDEEKHELASDRLANDLFNDEKE
jgi:hypothetical protein